MPRYEVRVRVWDEYTIEITADSEEEAEALAIEHCEELGMSGDGGRDVEEIVELDEPNEDDEEEED